ncbi:30S ribosomal protein S9 [Candidatus Giovannonibacteria bacterium]|nr:30S ribosomal protein S9 [Candidatus Giovannonibacteria bacterium]
MPPKKKIRVKDSKKTKAEARAKSAEKIIAVPEGKYVEAVGRRKTSVARVRIYPGTPFAFAVNHKPHEEYFPTFELRSIVEAPVSKTNYPKKFSVSVRVNGGGIHSQAEAVRHGISRVLEKIDPVLRKTLKPLGFLKRDPRAKERRKFGLKKARKAPQWAKR